MAHMGVSEFRGKGVSVLLCRFGDDPCKNLDGCFYELGVLFVGVLKRRALLFGSISAPSFWPRILVIAYFPSQTFIGLSLPKASSKNSAYQLIFAVSSTFGLLGHVICMS